MKHANFRLIKKDTDNLTNSILKKCVFTHNVRTGYLH